MPDEREQPTEPVHEDVRYESKDVRVKGVVIFGISLAAACLAIGFGMILLVNELVWARRQTPIAPIVRERPRLPEQLDKIPSPRLEESDTALLAELRKEEDVKLKQRGWVDGNKRAVRIPIAEAMQLLADPKTAEEFGVRARKGKGP